MSERVKRDSLVTLHYRVASGDGAELLGTFGATPATLQLGSGELAPPLEACVEGMAVGQRQVFVLDPQRAFGMHNPQLVQRIPRAELPDGIALEALSLVEFSAPTGGRLAGLVRELDGQAALIDFNHPLAGKSIRFEVEVIGIL